MTEDSVRHDGLSLESGFCLDHKWQVNNLKREFKQDSFFTQQNPIKQQVIK